MDKKRGMEAKEVLKRAGRRHKEGGRLHTTGEDKQGHWVWKGTEQEGELRTGGQEGRATKMKYENVRVKPVTLCFLT